MLTLGIIISAQRYHIPSQILPRRANTVANLSPHTTEGNDADKTRTQRSTRTQRQSSDVLLHAQRASEQTNLNASLCVWNSCHASRAPSLKSFRWIRMAVVKPIRSAPTFRSRRMAGLWERRFRRPTSRRKRAWRCRPRWT